VKDPHPIKLTPEQERVIAHRDGHLQVIACAGSGKTESISRRIAGLIAEGTDPASIVAFTFTERAAGELKHRITKRVEEAMGSVFLDRLGPMFVGTIHGYCFRLLQDHVSEYGNYDVFDENRHAGLLNREFFNLQIAKLGRKPVPEFIQNIDIVGNELINPSTLKGTPFGECYEAYLGMLDSYRFLTFSQIISKAVAALEDPAVFERVHGPLKHLVVDEYQDINPAQERLIQLLSQKPVDLCVVGDDDQSIYQWRGSEVKNILTFAKRKRAKTHSLLENRRSRPTVVKTANTFAGRIPERLPKEMKPSRPPGKNEIVCWSGDTPEEEAERIADTTERLHKSGYRYRDIAVLYRSVRTSAPPLIEELKQRGIPFSCGGVTGLFLQPEIALFGEAFSWLSDGTWQDERYGRHRPADLQHVVDGLDGFFGNGKPVKGIKKYLEDWKAFQLRNTRPVSLVGDFYKLLSFLGAHRIDIDTPLGSARLGSYARFTELLADFEHVHRRGAYVEKEKQRIFRSGRDRGKPYFDALAKYLVFYARTAYEDFAGEELPDLDAVDILTVHQSKGLEWPIVFMPSLVERRFPSQYAGRVQKWLLPQEVFPRSKAVRYEGGEAEERRLFYVGMTRARDGVYLSCFRHQARASKPSRFLEEISGGRYIATGRLPLAGPKETDREKESLPLELAFSDLALFEECGHRYRLASVFGFQQELAVELGYGKAVHHVLRHVAEKTRDRGKVPTSNQLEDLVVKEFFLPFASIPAFQRMQQSARRLVGRYVKDYSADLKRVWAVERPFELHLEDGIITGRADVILDEEGGKIGSLAIVDYKVAKEDGDKARDERFHRQLAIYAAAGRGEGLNVKGAYLHKLKDGSRLSVNVDEKEVLTAVQKAINSLKEIRQRKFSPSPEMEKCGVCDYNRVCSHCAAKMD
jgi:DNA helicase II / ATP-dependent DNA helicase PcrA